MTSTSASRDALVRERDAIVASAGADGRDALLASEQRKVDRIAAELEALDSAELTNLRADWLAREYPLKDYR